MSTTTININTEIDKEIKKLKEFEIILNRIEDKTKLLQLITIKEFAKISGWSESSVQLLFNEPDFPCCDFGKSKIAEINAVKIYLSKPRRKNRT